MPEKSKRGTFRIVLGKVYKFLFWIIPVATIVLILYHIDLPELMHNIKRVEFGYTALGLLLYPLIMVVGAFRWHFLLRSYQYANIPFSFTLSRYWSGLTVGFVAPATVGWDIYRVVTAGREIGKYGSNVAIIVVEKIVALIITMALILIIFPFTPLEETKEMAMVLHGAIWMLIIAVIVVVVANISMRVNIIHTFINKVELVLGNAVVGMLSKIGHHGEERERRAPIRDLLQPFVHVNILLPTLLLSLLIQAMTALANHYFFIAMGNPLPFMVNMFIMPILYFIYILPISFGSIGVREGSHIFFYGLFGVDPELALIAAFFGFIGAMLNVLIGGIFFLKTGTTLKNIKK